MMISATRLSDRSKLWLHIVEVQEISPKTVNVRQKPDGKGVRTAAAILKMTHNAPHVLAKKADAAVIKNLLMPNPLLPPGNTGG